MEEQNMAVSDHGFEDFWRAYPKKVGKGIARLQFQIAIRRTTLQTMLDALAWQKQQPQWTKSNGDFIPKPQNWLHGEQWADEPPTLSQRVDDRLSGLREFIDGD